MSIFSKVFNRFRNLSAKQLVIVGVFAFALISAFGAGLASRESSYASSTRDCSDNSVVRCGALSSKELVDKIKANQPSDLRTIFSHFGLPSSQYSNFQREAKQGTFHRDGRIVVDGKTVATNGYSLGRHNFGGSKAYNISGAGTYYYGTPSQRWSSGTSSFPVTVWFDKNGVVKMAVINACGNPVPKFDKRVPKVDCDDLQKHAVDGKKNTYRFSTKASKNNLVEYVSFKYYYNDGSGYKLFDTKKSPSTKTKELTLTKSATVKVEIDVKLPGGNKKTITSKDCETKITVKKPFFECKNLVASIRNDEETEFRFTVHTRQGNGAELRDVDFAIWKESDPENVENVTGVTERDEDGNIYYQVEFADDGETRVVEATVNFNIGSDVKNDKCKAKVTPKEQPKCPLPGKGHLPPDHPDCEDKPEEPEKELPKAGAASMLGIFGSATGAGVAAHRLYLRRRQ